MAFRWRSWSLASMLIGALPFAGGARAAEPQVPVLWDAKERLPKPDLSALPRLRFLTTTDFPPFNFLDGAGRLSGFHIDLARAICAELGIVDKCQIQALPWAELEGALRKAKAKRSSPASPRRRNRAQKYAFSRSYLQFPARFIMPKGKALAEPIFDKLRSKRVGVIAGSAHERMLRDYFKHRPDRPLRQAGSPLRRSQGGQDRRRLRRRHALRLLAGRLGCGRLLPLCRRPLSGARISGHGHGHRHQGRTIRRWPPRIDYALQEISMKGTFAEFYLRYFPVSFF